MSYEPPRNQTPISSARPRVILGGLAGGPRRPLDVRKTKAYKAASRRWISTIVALPILVYTSWVLFERTYGNKQRKRWNEVPASTPKSDDAK